MSSGLHAVDLFAQQFVAHAQIGDQRFQSLRLFVLDLGFPRFPVRRAALQELLSPAGQCCGGYAQFARECFEIFTA